MPKGHRPERKLSLSVRFPNYEDLVRLWYGPETRGQIARRYGVSERTIIVEWHRLRSEGKLPRGVTREEGRQDPHMLWNKDDAVSPFDCSPSVGGIDHLLKRLYEVHGEPRYDFYRRTTAHRRAA